MATTTALTTATPVEVDTALAEVYTRLYAEWDVQARLAKWIKDYEKGLAKKAEDQGRGPYSDWSEDQLNDLHDQMDASVAKALEIHAETHPYEAEYSRRPWTRFFLVQNNGGHIHSSMACSTCYATTQFGWLPTLSGQTEPEAVAAHGAILCTVCYPSAPTEWTNGTKPGDEAFCDSTQVDWDQPHRKGFAYGNWGHCAKCGEQASFTNSKTQYKLRKHKRPES